MTSLPTPYQDFIYLRTYSRWVDDLNRRETWPETVDRYHKFFEKRVPESKTSEFCAACDAIKNLEVMPSMRALWTAGQALQNENIAGYNCAFVAVDNLKVFSEILYVLMNGTGVGFSVERQFVNELPTIPEDIVDSDETVVFADSKLGWAEGFNKIMQGLYSGVAYKYDLSKIRPKGARLKVFGGRASGPDPLKQLIEFTISLAKSAKGRKLNSLECHDLVCMIASIVVVGGVRRSACISLSNLSDDRMRHAKDGHFWEKTPHRMLANNSVCYTEKPDAATFMQEWLSLIRSGSGERGIFNRQSGKFVVSKIGRREAGYEWGCNPCSEILLRPNEFCNLSEVVVKDGDDLDSLKKKVRMATILGVMQSTLTKFRFLSRDWKKNCEEERLLGVSLTGLRDHDVLGHVSSQSKLWLQEMKLEAIATAEEWSRALGINMPAAITCVKPSGTVSQLVNSASGLHPRYSPHYIRRVRVSTSDPLCKLLIDQGVKYNPEVGQTLEDCSTMVFDFPVASPEKAVFRDEVNALEQLEYWKMLQEYWCEHKPSVTIYVKDDEWIRVGSWVYDNWNYVSGISFLPHDGGVYQLAPYEEISEDVYNCMLKLFPTLDFTQLQKYEAKDQTMGSREFACSAGACEI